MPDRPVRRKQHLDALSIDRSNGKLASSTTTTQTMAWQRPHQHGPLDPSEWLTLKEAAMVDKDL